MWNTRSLNVQSSTYQPWKYAVIYTAQSRQCIVSLADFCCTRTAQSSNWIDPSRRRGSGGFEMAPAQVSPELTGPGYAEKAANRVASLIAPSRVSLVGRCSECCAMCLTLYIHGRVREASLGSSHPPPCRRLSAEPALVW
jgi:hypothetical protein